MRLALYTTLILASFGLAALAPVRNAQPTRSALAAEGTTYSVDPVHSNVLFKIKHNKVSYFYGRFNDISGSFTLDEDDASSCSVEIEIKAESVDTRSDKLNSHLRSPDFFDAKQFPVITFKSTKVKAGKGDTYEVTGDLDLHGVTRSITVTMEHVGSADGRRGKLAGFHTVFTIDRTDYGMNYGAGGLLGSDVEMIISIEAGAH